ncbi:MAG: hypothetical protein JF615_04185, partial [Asticcacaulis sp.]|nr:hypothetical protein [Asticcacaulis sp.]
DTLKLRQPWDQRSYSLSRARSVQVDCRGGGDNVELRYNVEFPDKSVNLAVRRDIVNRLDEGGVFARLEAIDAYLRQSGVPITRTRRDAKSAQTDGACHNIWVDEIHPDGAARFDRLLYGESN